MECKYKTQKTVTMLDHINSLEQLEKDSKEIDDYLNCVFSEDINELVIRGNDIVVYMAKTCKMLADAKYHQDKAVENSILKQLNIDLPASILNKLIQSTCKGENYLVNWIDRLNRTCTHQIDYIRTLISKAKAEMQYQ